MLTTLLTPTGTATVAGCDIRSDPAGVRRRIGFIGRATAPATTSTYATSSWSRGTRTGCADGRRTVVRTSCWPAAPRRHAQPHVLHAVGWPAARLDIAPSRLPARAR
jgi:hypothetical protein